MRYLWWRPADGTSEAVTIVGIRHLPLAAARKRYIRLARRRKGHHRFLAAQKSPPGTDPPKGNGQSASTPACRSKPQRNWGENSPLGRPPPRRGPVAQRLGTTIREVRD